MYVQNFRIILTEGSKMENGERTKGSHIFRPWNKVLGQELDTASSETPCFWLTSTCLVDDLRVIGAQHMWLCSVAEVNQEGNIGRVDILWQWFVFVGVSASIHSWTRLR